MLMPKFTVQFRKRATPIALSFIISAKYKKVIGPDENSKKVIKSNTLTTIPIVFWTKAKYARRSKVAVIAILKTSMMSLRPRQVRRRRPKMVATKLTMPTRAVTVVLLMSRPLNTIFE